MHNAISDTSFVEIIFYVILDLLKLRFKTIKGKTFRLAAHLFKKGLYTV